MKEPVQRERILEAARKRFAHFGSGKTTLTEIADDLSLSKQALSHYFPDKQSLIRAVTTQLLEQYMEALRLALAESETVYNALLALVEIRNRFGRPNHLFFAQLESDGQWFNRDARAMLLRMARRERQLLVARFAQGVASGELRLANPGAAARILLEALASIGRTSRNCPPDDRLFESRARQQRELVTLIYNGLGKEPWKQ
ncbi:MAG: TetR/AcrR family transcriptional regulator [Chitinophagaceae bacterium]|nr:MAG: TetR/AcrR family transcriptional regulator [Chitinophagaceae bacterium]